VGTVTARELKNRTGAVLRRVGSGERVTVTLRGTPVAQFVPVSRQAKARRSDGTRRALRTLVRSIAGKYSKVGTVDEFLAQKAREIIRER
jgi:prevent-host-death family protein